MAKLGDLLAGAMAGAKAGTAKPAGRSIEPRATQPKAAAPAAPSAGELVSKLQKFVRPDDEPEQVSPMEDRVLRANEPLNLRKPEASLMEKTEPVEDKERKGRVEDLGLYGKDALHGPAEPAKVEEMTTDDYLKLTPKQRAAVDFNTILSSAVENDKAKQDQYIKNGIEDDTAYETRSRELFGEDRGSETFAPETLAVLSKLKLDDKLADLDDYLGLQVAITEDDLELLNSDPVNKTMQKVLDLPVGVTGAPGGTEPEDTSGRADYANSVANKTRDLQETLAKGNDLLQSFGSTVQRDIAGDAGRIGGDVDKPDRALGFGGNKLDETFRDYYNILALKDGSVEATPEDVLNDARANLAPEALESFFSYAETRSRNAKEYGMDLGDRKDFDGEVEFRKPEEFRKLLGLED